MHSKKQLIQYLKQFPNTQLVRHWLELLRYAFERLNINETSNHFLCSIHSDSNALYLQLNNVPFLVHKIRERQHFVEFLCYKSDETQLNGLQKFYPHKQKINNQLVGMARLILSKESLTNQQNSSIWLKAVQDLAELPKKKPHNHASTHNPWLYRAAMDMFVHNDLLKAITTKDKYLSIIPKAIHELLRKKDIRQIQTAKSFWFEQAQVILERFNSLELPLEVYEQCGQDYQSYTGRFDAFVEETSQQSYHQLIQLIGELVSYIDAKATGKQQWNSYKDKRSVAQTGVRQNLWVQQLLQYKQAGNNIAAITTPIIKNALNYIQQPASNSPILSISHQRQIANHLLDTTYQSNQFTLQLVSYFNKFDLSAEYFDNYTYLIKELLYAPSVKALWKYTEEDIYQDELILHQIGEPLTGYKVASNTSSPLNQILYGPPGTGKTYESIRRAISLVENKHWAVVQQMDQNTIQKRMESYMDAGQVVFTTFHQSMSYEDFVEGIKPTVVNNQVHYAVKDGLLKTLVQNAINDPEKIFVLIIDELNRGNVANIFGELITLLEEDKRLQQANTLKIQLPYSKQLFSLPPNLYCIATMNTTDRSIEQLDMALRRRFSFIEMLPDPLLLSEDVDDINLRLLLTTINERILVLLDEHHLLGHAYFMSVGCLEDLQTVFKTQLIPLLLEYFYGDLGKIGLILGKAFVQSEPLNYKRFADFDYEDMDRAWDKPVYQLSTFPLSKAAYQAVYQ